MSEQTQGISQLTALVSQQEKARAERTRIRAAIARLQDQDIKLRNFEFDLQNQIHDLRIQHNCVALPTSAAPSPKNLDFLRAWAALQSEMTKSGPAGLLPQHICAEVIRKAVHGVADATIRSHLHRLKTRGFIEKIGSNWRLAAVKECVANAAEFPGVV